MSESKLGFRLVAGSDEIVSVFGRAFDLANNNAPDPTTRKEIAITNNDRMAAMLHPNRLELM